MKITEKFMGFQILLLQFREALYVQEEALIFFPNEISIPRGSITSQVCPHQLVKLADNRGINSVADNEERSMEMLITEG